MSYARKGPGSDVYVFASHPGELHCCWCALVNPHRPPYVQDFNGDHAEMILHMFAHARQGQRVPTACMIRLVNELREGDELMLTEEDGP